MTSRTSTPSWRKVATAFLGLKAIPNVWRETRYRPNRNVEYVDSGSRSERVLWVLHYRRHDWCRKFSGYIMLTALIGMVAMSIRTVIYDVWQGETFTQSVEQFSEIIPRVLDQRWSRGSRSNLSKEMGYNLAVMRDIIDEKTTASQAVDRVESQQSTCILITDSRASDLP
jgi:hypothetical protein